MADSPSNAATDDVTGTPRWVKVAGIIVLVLVLVFVVLKLTGLGGSHGPGRHAPGADTSRGHTGPPSGVTHSQP
jgi:hypothetical protein